ncbi:MAG: tyrosine-protein phosphatase [Isosphaeraceae bacterium]
MRIVYAIAALAAAGVGVWLTVETQNNRLVWDHFDVVKHGILYRSGQLNPSQLEAAVGRYGIRTLISFQLPGEGVDRERAIAKRLNIDFVNLPMPGDGFGQEHQFRKVLEAVDDPERRPVLIHCARGTCRTGAAVALYRFERDGWTVDDVAAEMRRQVYREGWLPGYVYNMVQHRPYPERYQPQIVHDRNLKLPVPSLPPPAEAPHDETAHRHQDDGKEATHVR